MPQDTYNIPLFCDLHVDIWDKMDGIISHKSWTTENKFLAYDQLISSCGIGTAALCLLLQDGPDGRSNCDEISNIICHMREVKSSAPLLSEHVIHLRVEFLDNYSINTAIQLVEKHSDIVKIVSLVDHIPGYRQYGDGEQWYAAYQRRFGFSRTDLDAMATRRRRNLGQRQRLISEIASEIAKHPVLLFSHDDEITDEVAFAVASGAACVEFPLSLAAADTARENNVPFLVGTPNLLRGNSSFGNASAEFLIHEGGKIIFSSDYLPHSIFLALSKMSGGFSDYNIAEKFFEYAVFEPAALLARVGICHDTQTRRQVRVGQAFSQLHGVG